MGMVCCVAKVHDSVQDDLKRDAEVMSPPQPEIDLQITRQKDISRQLIDCDLQDNKGENKVSHQVEDNTNVDVTQEVDHASVEDPREDHSIDNYSINLLSLPTELLVKIMLYLPIIDRIMMLHISQRFRNMAEIPLLWRHFKLKNHHMIPSNIKSLLKVIRKHVRSMHIYIRDVPSNFEKIMCNVKWRRVTHLILYEGLSLELLDMTVDAMPHLQYLGMKLSFKRYNDDYDTYYGGIRDTVALLKAIPVRLTVLMFVLSLPTDLESVVTGIQVFVNEYYADALPSLIKIFGRFNITATDNSAYNHTSGNYGQRHRRNIDSSVRITANATDNLFKFWSKSAFSLSPFVIQLYDKVPNDTPIRLFPPVPMRSYKFGKAATPTLIQLPAYGIVGLKDNMFHFSKYIDDHGMVRHAVTLDHGDCGSLIEERHITCTPHLHTVSYVDISYENVNSNHLQQLAIACPNLQQLHLQGNVNCLKDLQGLQAIVDKCKNLKNLNLAGIDVSRVESYLLLWDILSSLKKLNLLTIDLCMILLYDYDDDDKKKLVTMCKSCYSLLALNVHLGHRSCIECNSSNENFLFSHFPSLTYCALWGVEYSSVKPAFTNCRHLKYIYSYGKCGDYDSRSKTA